MIESRLMACRVKVILVLFCTVFQTSFAQKKDNKSDFQVRGNISTGAFHYYENTENPQLKSFGASLGINANISYGRFSIPIGVSINNQSTSFQNPFNRYGISPTYRWIKVNLGWRRMNFSKFTMNGVQFFGAGIELTPGIFRFKAMHGKLDYSIPGLSRELIDNLPKRKISALKIGIGNRKNHFDIVFMKARDNIDLDTLSKPKENAAIGADLKFGLFKNKVIFKVNSGVSIFTENRKLSDALLREVSVPDVNSIIKPNISTHMNYAIEAGIDFNFGAFSLHNLYRRVMPEYQSLGLNYLRNDQESILFSPNLRLWKSKLSIGGSVGLEKNNLDDLRNLDQSRVITSIFANIRPNIAHNLNFQFSNYSFDQTVKFDSLITNNIVIQQVNRSIGGSYIYTTFGDSKTQLLSISTHLQDAINAMDDRLNNTTLSAMVSYSISNNESNSSLNFGFNYFDISIVDSSIRQIGLNTGYSFRSGRKSFNINGGGLISLEDKLLNNHLALKYRMQVTKKLSIELSSRARYNQRARKNDKLIVRSDFRLVMKL